jgi:hypothetical protein
MLNKQRSLSPSKIVNDNNEIIRIVEANNGKPNQWTILGLLSD